MRRVLEQIASWRDRSPVPIVIHGQQFVTRGRFSRMLESARRRVEVLGLAPGQRCAVELHHPGERLLVTLAVASEGVVPVHFPPGSPRSFRLQLAQRLDLKAVLLTNERLALPGVRSDKWTAGHFAGSHGNFAPRRELAEDAPAVIIFSDGIEGPPRPIQLDVAAVQFRIDAALEDLQLDDRSRVLVAGAGPAGLPIALASILRGSLQIHARDDPLAEMVRHGVSHAFFGSQAFSRLAKQVQRSPVRLPGLKRLQTFAERLWPAEVNELSSMLTENLFAGYFLAELGVIATAAAPALQRSIQCRGRIADDVEVEIRNRDGGPAAATRPGELWIRAGPGSGRCLDDDGSYAAATKDGWLQTGMVARRSQSGALYLDGRRRLQRARPPDGPTTGQVEQWLLQRGVAQMAVAMWLEMADAGSVLVVAVPSRREQERARRALQRLLGKESPMRVVHLESWPTTPFGELSLGRLRSQLERVL